MDIANKLNSRPCMDCTQWAGRSKSIIPVGLVQDYLQHRLKPLETKNARGREITAKCPSGVYVMKAPRVLVRKCIGKLGILKGGTYTWKEVKA